MIRKKNLPDADDAEHAEHADGRGFFIWIWIVFSVIFHLWMTWIVPMAQRNSAHWESVLFALIHVKFIFRFQIKICVRLRALRCLRPVSATRSGYSDLRLSTGFSFATVHAR